MKRILGYLRRADREFGLIKAGDRVAVGVSGGKDSLVLLKAMALYRYFQPFELFAVTIHMGFEPFDTSGIAALCEQLKVPFRLVHTHIGPIVFEERKEPNPCSLCARMRGRVQAHSWESRVGTIMEELAKLHPRNADRRARR